MASCPACGADITWANVEGESERVPLEKWTDTTGPRRYRVTDLGPPLVVVPVVESALPTAGYPDHRVDCPASGNGLGR